MPAPRLEFEIPEDSDPQVYLDEINTYHTLVPDGDSEFDRVFLDSFDWRLFRKGFILFATITNGTNRLTLQAFDTLEFVCVQAVDRIPAFVADLPAGKMRKTLAPILEMRALLPQARLKGRQRRWKLVNEQGKTILQVRIEWPKIDHADQQPRNLRSRFHIEGVKYRAKDFTAVKHLLQKRIDIPPDTVNLLISCLDGIGRRPVDYTSKLGLTFEPSMRADSAFRMLFSRLFAILESNELGTIQQIDSEFLHDFRVAIRKTRALLNQSKEILSPDRVEKFAKEFAWLGKAAGLCRDLDVYLLSFDNYKESIPVSLRQHLEPLRKILYNQRAEAQLELVKVLESSRYVKLKKEWRRFLVEPSVEDAAQSLAETPIRRIANVRIRQVYKKIHRKSRAIDTDTKPAALHRLRIRCKKLRYLMEFFGSLYPKKPIRRLIKSLKGLQDDLGRFQDLEVQSRTLQKYRTAMMDSGTAARTLLAMEVLVQELDQQRERVHRDFLQRFQAFDSAEHRRLFKSLLKNEKTQEKHTTS